MPHLIIECGARLSASVRDRLIRDAHQALLESGQVRKPTDLKSRLVQVEQDLVGQDSPELTFVHAELRLLAGRSAETRQELADLLLKTLTQDLAPEVQASVEVRELAATYAKRQPS
ncbi:5-carboxymethyl-2-hydroxymuconate Delta-isomerase [Kineosporia babensis]|uniref:5-carboxymethyl-2-hydroxymuconate Delta-isomerase n=1 Tax=Kineosporia babensis TaxID=499548 RepID=A0A9X1NB44_9ACTN|nr:5-carboxymethyl-2-hydroxymuconate Delta-isomerase [Kineosporia babensis]MCD5310589.1 5-carboxymethyl-2-hydroxymuconate Delta-isomerase [Kineosporia babensis]